MNKSDVLTNQKLEELEKRIKELYTKSYKELKKKTEVYWAQLGKREAELIEKLDNNEIQLLPNEDRDTYLRKWKQAQIGRGKRWQAMRDEMARRITQANEIASSLINNDLAYIYALNQSWQAYEIGKGLEGIAFNLMDEYTIKNLILNEGNFTEFKTTKINPKRDYEWNSQQIQKTLTSGIMQGKPIKDIANDFERVMKRNQASALRNARTSYTSAQNGGRISGLRQAKAQGINVKKQWLSAHDGRVRDSHATLNGQIRDVEDRFDNGLMFPADSEGRPAEVYNCRCTLTYIYPKWDKDRSSEIYKDEKLGKETYNQFVKRMSKENPERIDANKQRYKKR